MAGVLLAAGISARMGQPKALLPWAGLPLVRFQVAALLGGGVDEVVVVLGHEAERVDAAVAGLPASTVVNDGYLTGKCSSIRCGVGAVSSAADAILLVGVDQPRPPWIIRQLLDAHATGGTLITVPFHGGHRGHPVVCAAVLRGELLAVAEETEGLRAVLDRHTGSIQRVPVGTDLIHLDLNTSAAYQAAVQTWGLMRVGGWELAADVARVEAMLGPLPVPVSRPALVALVGLPGVGKSTIAAAIAQRLPVAIVRSDAVRKLLFPQPTYDRAESARVFRVIHQVLRGLLSRGISIVLDATNLTESQRQPIRQIAAATGARLLFVHIQTPPEVVRERLARRAVRRVPGDLSDATWAVYEELRRRYEPIRGPHLEVDGSAEPAAIADAILAALDAQP